MKPTDVAAEPFPCRRCGTRHEKACCHPARHSFCQRCEEERQERRYRSYLADTPKPPLRIPSTPTPEEGL